VDADLPAITVVQGDADGPTVGLLGGVHGDEYEGVVATRALARILHTELVRGTVRIAAPAHPAAWAARTRCSPDDGADLARVFPGRPDGTPTEQVAHAVTERVVRGADLLIDLHSGGAGFAMPFLCGYQHEGERGIVAQRYADTFGARFTWRHAGAPAPGRSLSAAAQLGVPAIYVEGLGGLSIRAAELQGYIDGVRRVLHSLDMIAEAPPPPGPTLRVCGDGNTDDGIRAPIAGYVVAHHDVGDMVDVGDVIASIVDLDAAPLGEIVAATRGALMLLRRDARVSAGDTVCIVAPPDDGP
jgi:predicted deacylase